MENPPRGFFRHLTRAIGRCICSFLRSTEPASSKVYTEKLKDRRDRIRELNDKSTQVLLFLTFGLTAAAILWSSSQAVTPQARDLLRLAMWHWVLAIFPTILIVAPLKDFAFNNLCWYQALRILKVALLLGAVFFISWGTYDFLWALRLLTASNGH